MVPSGGGGEEEALVPAAAQAALAASEGVLSALARGRLRLQSWLLAEADAGRPFLFLPVAMACGILLYFAAATEPWPAAGPLAMLLYAMLSLALRRRGGAPRATMVAFAALFAGFSAASLRTAVVAAPVLSSPLMTEIRGFVEAVDRRASGGRILVRLVAASGLAPAALPLRVRLTLPERPAVRAGDFVIAKARLMPPPEASRPGGYDFAREAFFQGIGAVGSIPGAVRVSAPEVQPGFDLILSAWVDRARNDLTERIARAIGDGAGGVAASLVTGKRGLIPEEVNDDLRGAGIYHVVSISGLHMVLAAGMVFWIVRALLALSPRLVACWPVKKLAALAGMAAALAYNVFAGSEIATERSLVMTVVLLGAILADRPALSMRNLAFAAMAVLAMEPESLLGPSFQMSFGAVAALIALFERGPAEPASLALTPRRDARGRDGPPPGPVMRIALGARHHVLVAIGSTLVAEAATAPFSLYHFQRITVFGIFGNLLTLPLVSAIVMPAALIGILAVPFGLDGPVWTVMGWGVQGMLVVSARVAALPGAIATFPAFGPAALLAMAAAIVWATLWRTGLRWGAVPLAVTGLGLATQASAPDIVVAGDGRSLAWRGPDGRLGLLGRGAGSFTIEQWLRADGDPRSADDPALAKAGRCDGRACVGRFADERAISLVTDPIAFADDCGRAAILVTPLNAPDWCRPRMLIDRRVLGAQGAQALHLGRNGEVTRLAAREEGVSRPWLRALPGARQIPRTPASGAQVPSAKSRSSPEPAGQSLTTAGEEEDQ